LGVRGFVLVILVLIVPLVFFVSPEPAGQGQQQNAGRQDRRPPTTQTSHETSPFTLLWARGVDRPEKGTRPRDRFPWRTLGKAPFRCRDLKPEAPPRKAFFPDLASIPHLRIMWGAGRDGPARPPPPGRGTAREGALADKATQIIRDA